jgi:lactoylglutathione lyase
MPAIGAVIIVTADLDAAVAFYQAVSGLSLDREQHGADEPVHYAVEADGCHVAIFGADHPGSAPAPRTAGETMIGFEVESVEASVDAARALGASILQEPRDYPWGRRALIEDTDGRRVEVFTPPA